MAPLKQCQTQPSPVTVHVLLYTGPIQCQIRIRIKRKHSGNTVQLTCT